jgi:hypothetical protein
MARTGRCYCGVVRYRLDGELGPLVNCHCRSCRRAHGSAFATVARVPSGELHVTAGADAVREYRTGEGSRCFCERCGGRLFNRAASSDAFVMVVVATLDDEPEDRPVMHVNVESKAPWYEILDRLPQHAALP